MLSLPMGLALMYYTILCTVRTLPNVIQTEVLVLFGRLRSRAEKKKKRSAPTLWGGGDAGRGRSRACRYARR
ncbi:uncharacterized protein BDZ83DRAFT_598388 [Colletotrichum acutatum]|uniref:Uncharacterized protein n=1 Tax=Glomerella acutata TaxID=27357 RepID=A0AAD9D291_GLOAC|nr:uncharacterized protein BDZ83DRAFT_598388 [Colletotrichum acutatum]KAK1731198.1 hypothetical protein BDZ83DRAFT_598388 [Colletotrichum acutatum]